MSLTRTRRLARRRAREILLALVVCVGVLVGPAAASALALTASLQGIAEGTNPQFQFVSSDTVFVNTTVGHSGSFTVTVQASDPGGIDEVSFPDLNGGYGLAGWSGGGSDFAPPYSMTYVWVAGADDPVVSAPYQIDVYTPVDQAAVEFTVLADNDAPSMLSLAYPSPFSTVPVGIALTSGAFEASDFAGNQFQRKSAPLTADACGTWDVAWTTVATNTVTQPYVDATAASGFCYQYRFMASDAVGNASAYYEPGTITKRDTAGPAGVTLSYPAGYRASTSVPVTYAPGTDAASGIASATLAVQDAQLIDGVCQTFGAFGGAQPGASPVTQTGLTNGRCYRYRYAATDNAGNTTFNTSTDEVRVDTTLPTGMISASPAGPVRASLTVAGTATDGSVGASGMDHVTVAYTGPESGTFCASVVPAPGGAWSCGSNDISGLIAGSYTLSMHVFDRAGNDAGPYTRSIVVDNDAPTVAYTAPASDGTTQTGAFTLAGTSNDPATGVVSVAATWTGPGATSGSACTDPAPTLTTWTCQWSSAGRPGGTYSVLATATDAAGNTSTALRSLVLANPEVLLSPSSFTLTEGGGGQLVNVTLVSAPSASVVVSFAPGTGVGMSQSSLIFSTGNWNVPQSVTITAVDDAVDEAASVAASVDVTSSSTAPEWDGIVKTINGTVADNDTAAVVVTESGGSTRATEGGVADTFSVALASEPTAAVTIDLTNGGEVTVSPTQLTFTSMDWSTPQTVTVAAVDDADDELSPEAAPITLTVGSSDPIYAALAAVPVAAQVVDNDAAGVAFNSDQNVYAVAEGGMTDTMGVVLTSRPSAPVTVIFGSAEVTYAPTSVVFTAANWNVRQVVTITAISDNDSAEGQHQTVTFVTVSSTDPAYNQLPVTGPTIDIADGTIDEFPPQVTFSSTPDFDLDGTATLTWSTADLGNGPYSYTLESRTVTTIGAGFSAWKELFGPTPATARKVTMPAKGNTYCFRVRVVDGGGNQSAPSTERCVAVPLDDRVWKRTRGWNPVAKRGALASTVTQSTTKGAFLTLNMTAKRVGVLVTKCRTCGTLKVTFAGKVVGTYNLKSSRTMLTQLIRLKPFPAAGKGKLKLEVVSSGKPVEIDGLLIWRS